MILLAFRAEKAEALELGYGTEKVSDWIFLITKESAASKKKWISFFLIGNIQVAYGERLTNVLLLPVAGSIWSVWDVSETPLRVSILNEIIIALSPVDESRQMWMWTLKHISIDPYERLKHIKQ